MRAVRSLRTGGVILNGTSTFRTDQLAYGGIKDSGIGREGPKYAIRDMTDERLVVFNLWFDGRPGGARDRIRARHRERSGVDATRSNR